MTIKIDLKTGCSPNNSYKCILETSSVFLCDLFVQDPIGKLKPNGINRQCIHLCVDGTCGSNLCKEISRKIFGNEVE